MSRTGELHARGKVRDVYEAGEHLLIVASDRISAFDVILPTPIPDKGRVLTALSAFWFMRTGERVPNHVVSLTRSDFPEPFRSDPELAGRATLVRRADVIPLECVARGYLSGSGWTQYRDSGTVCGVPLPPGLRESDRLSEPVFTPTTKATEGHDLPVTPEEGRDLVGTGLFERLRELTIGVYEHVTALALERGIIVADTKFEFGRGGQRLLLVDEALTPDSSRFWPADRYAPDQSPPSFDKQFVRDWLERTAWDKNSPPPRLPADVVAETRAKYVEALVRLTGRALA